MDDDELLMPDDTGHLDVKDREWTYVHPILWSLSQQLISLDISFNNITSLPDPIGDLTLLTDLNCSCNHLQVLPATIGKLRALKRLKANGNQLLTLPAETGKCRQLQTLLLSENLITVLPETLADCIHLAVLKIENNNLTQLPLQLASLKDTLRDVDVSNNEQLHMFPKECGSNTSVILWILSFHLQKSTDLETIRVATHDMTQLLQINDEAIAELTERVSTLRAEQDQLQAERASVRWYLRVKSVMKKCNVISKKRLIEKSQIFLERRVSRMPTRPTS